MKAIKEKSLKYLGANKTLITKYREENFDVENLLLLNKALLMSPLDSTLWNYRSKIMMANFSQELIEQELNFIVKAIELNAKIYTVWDYRRLLVQRLKERDALNVEREK